MPSRTPRIAERTNVLVVGGAGFLGSHLCEFLLEKHNVICIDTYFSGKEQNIDGLLANPHFEFIRHDMREPLDFKQFKGLERFRVAHIGVQHIYYLATSVSPTVYLKYPVDVSMTCSVGTRNVLDLAVEWRARLLFLSSAVLYGNGSTDGPISEEQSGELDWRAPEEWYSSALRFGESLIEMYRATYSLETKIVRLFQTYGPRMHFDDGRFIPELIRAHVQNEEIAIDERFTQASCLYVSDAVDALEKIMLSEKGTVYNLGSPSSYSVDEIIAAVARLTGAKSRIRRAVLDSAALRVQYAWMQYARTPNMALLRDAAAWFPVVLLEEGLQKTIDYMKALRGIRRIAS